MTVLIATHVRKYTNKQPATPALLLTTMLPPAVLLASINTILLLLAVNVNLSGILLPTALPAQETTDQPITMSATPA